MSKSQRRWVVFVIGTFVGSVVGWVTPGSAAAAPAVLGGEFEMRAVVIQEQGLYDRSEGTRYTRTLRFRRVAGGRCAWRIAFETVNGDFDRSPVCRTGDGRFVSHGSYTRQCRYDLGSARGQSVLRFRVTRRVRRDGRRYIARIAGRFRAQYRGDCDPRRASETWKFSAGRTDLPPAPAKPTADFSFDPNDPSVTGVRNTVFFTDGSYDSDDNGTIKRRSWDFGDPGSGPANIATVAEPSHTYAVAGNYRVILNVTDDRGLKDSSSQVVYVAP